MSSCPRNMPWCTDNVRRLRGASNGQIVNTENAYCEKCIEQMKPKLMALGVPEWVFDEEKGERPIWSLPFIVYNEQIENL